MELNKKEKTRKAWMEPNHIYQEASNNKSKNKMGCVCVYERDNIHNRIHGDLTERREDDPTTTTAVMATMVVVREGRERNEREKKGL